MCENVLGVSKLCLYMVSCPGVSFYNPIEGNHSIPSPNPPPPPPPQPPPTTGNGGLPQRQRHLLPGRLQSRGPHPDPQGQRVTRPRVQSRPLHRPGQRPQHGQGRLCSRAAATFAGSQRPTSSSAGGVLIGPVAARLGPLDALARRPLRLLPGVARDEQRQPAFCPTQNLIGGLPGDSAHCGGCGLLLCISLLLHVWHAAIFTYFLPRLDV